MDFVAGDLYIGNIVKRTMNWFDKTNISPIFVHPPFKPTIPTIRDIVK